MEQVHTQRYGWEKAMEDYCSQLEETHPLEASDWDNTRRIRLLSRMVDHYRQYQQETGEIIDPYSGAERYYSTPSYAMSAGLLVQQGREDLLSSAAAALTSSIDSLVRHQAPDEHPDFFPVMIMGAYRLLHRLVPQQAVYWREQLSRIVPEEAYVFTMNKINNPNRMINWNAIMLSGEYMRHTEGLANKGTDWMDVYLQNYHLPRFTSLGLYQDGPLNLPNCPFAYDVVTRYHLTLMMLSGYDGQAAEELRRYLRYGAMSSLLSLSPLGEMPIRGRSSQHQWNEAAAALIFTVQAVQTYRQGQQQLAGAYRRAADLTWNAVEQWQMPEGCLHIVRNYHPPEQRHGYEVYTNHTCYNLWTAAALAYSIQYGEELEQIVPYPVPAELGSRVLETDGWFQTTFSTVPGQQLVIHTALNDPYNIPGMARIHRSGLPGLIGPSAAGYRDQGFTRFAEGDVFPLAYTPAWQTSDGHWHHLAEGIAGTEPFNCDVGIDPAAGGGCCTLLEDDGTGTASRFTLQWKGPLGAIGSVLARYEHVPGTIRVTYELEEKEPREQSGNIMGIGAWLPLFMSDGQHLSDIEPFSIEQPEQVQELPGKVSASQAMQSSSTPSAGMAVGGQGIRVSYRGSKLEIIPLTRDVQIVFPEEASSVACRNGLLRGARLEASGKQLAFEIRLDRQR
ncbi:glycosyl hydrolase [Paenibacillus sp. Z6-24]